MTSVRLGALAAAVACASLWAGTAGAQVYRMVGPDGRVTFSDRPPPDAKAAAAPSVPMARGGGAVATASLPIELRNVTSRFPVTLYTSKDCGACDSARSFLSARGVPFVERTVTTDADIRALQGLSGATNVPFATLGGQHLKGFSDGEWSQYLDAAGYPKTSQLPAGYRNPPASPLVALPAPTPIDPNAPAAGAQADAAPAQRAAPAPAPAPTNPAGIRF